MHELALHLKENVTMAGFRLLRWSVAPLIAALVLGLVSLSPSAQAADDAPADDAPPTTTTMFSKEYVKEVWNRDKLGGDWLGIRKNLTDNGIYPEFRLSQFYQGSTSGGIRDHAEYGGKMDYKFNVDANKLMGTWQGLYVNLHVESRWGQDIEKDVGAFSLVNTPMAYPLPGDYSGTQVTQLLVMQAFMDGRLDVFAGKLNVVDLLTTLVPSTGFGQEGFMNVNSLASAWPWFRFVNLSIFGAGAWWNDDKGRIKYAAFVFGQENVSTTWRIHDSFDSGVGFLGFVREYWEIGDKVGWIAGFAGGATRQYQALDSTDWSVLLSTDNTDFLIVGLGDRDDRPWSVASYIYQEFWKGSKEGQQAHIMMGASYAREGPSFANWNYFVSVEATGLVPSRAGDRMGAAFSYNNLSPDLQSLAATVGIGLRDAWNVEIYYNVEVNKWLHMTADFQLVENGRRGDSLAVIPGVRAVVDF